MDVRCLLRHSDQDNWLSEEYRTQEKTVTTSFTNPTPDGWK